MYIILTISGFGYITFLEILDKETVSGVLVAHTCHLLSVHMLYQLSRVVFLTPHSGEYTKFAFIAASLHVISPAGLFLSAPYSESLFAFLSFLGFYCYAQSLRVGSHYSLWVENLNILLSGLLFGFATSVRSNGLLNGLIFGYDITRCAPSLLQSGDRSITLSRILTAACGGALVALGFLLPQYLAYDEFCVAAGMTEDSRPWCYGWFPSIYAWVQSQYW